MSMQLRPSSDSSLKQDKNVASFTQKVESPSVHFPSDKWSRMIQMSQDRMMDRMMNPNQRRMLLLAPTLNRRKRMRKHQPMTPFSQFLISPKTETLGMYLWAINGSKIVITLLPIRNRWHVSKSTRQRQLVRKGTRLDCKLALDW